MKRLVVNSKATGSYPVDAMRITIRFVGVSEHTREAIEWAQEQYEDFMDKLCVIGVGSKCVDVLDDGVLNGVQQSTYLDDTLTLEQDNQICKANAWRTIVLQLPADSKVNTSILNLIRHNNYVCNYNVEYYIAEPDKYRTELIAKATESSQLQAETIAKLTGKKLVGIESVYTSIRRYIPDGRIVRGQDYRVEYESQKTCVEDLTLTMKELSEEVEVTWCME